jgi:hypothetical protein
MHGIMWVFHDFHASSKFERNLNATFIALISKKNGAIDLKDFRSVRLVSEVYTIIAKVLANTLRRDVEKGRGEDYFEAPKCLC